MIFRVLSVAIAFGIAIHSTAAFAVPVAIYPISIPVDQDVMTSGFFTGSDLLRGYDADDRAVHRVSTDAPFGTSGAETVYLTFDPSEFASLVAPVPKATLRVTSVAGGFDKDANAGSPFLVSAHGVDADPLLSITDDTNPTGPTSWLDFLNNNILPAAPEASTVVTGFGTIEFDITALVNAWVDGSNTIHTVALTGKNDTSGGSFLHGIVNNSETPGVSHSITVVPEPTGMASLFVAALSGTAATFRRRRRRTGGCR